MSKKIYAPEEIIPGKKKDSTYVFLAGPIQGVHNWQDEDIPEIPEYDVTFIIPRRKEMDPDFNWQEQVDWETKALRISDYVLFWIPKEEEKIPGRDYAQTTKIELMENLVRGKHIILGIQPGVHTRRYLIEKANLYRPNNSSPLYKIHDNLEDCIEELRTRLKWDSRRTELYNTFFTSDTHFGQERALTLSLRPFKDVEEMDWTMVERWNKYVRPNSIVYHLGDFGNYEMLKYLNGKVILIRGNHDKEEKEKLLEYGFSDVTDSTITFMYPKTDIEDDFDGAKLILGHEPKTCLEVLKSEDKEYTYALFGHIHGKQKVKKFGIDVGVDANNFYPMRATKEVRFLINALQKGYDDEVFVYSNHGT